jgi:phosphatidate cytidylyltransferase
MSLDPQYLWLGVGVGSMLALASVLGWILQRQARTDAARATIENLNARTRAWWIMFAILSFLGLREFITLTPTRRGDHRALFWAFFVITPLQYYFVARWWYGMFAIFIPVYAFLFLPVRSALAGDCDRFLERAAKIQWGLMACVYCLSHAAALLKLEIPGSPSQRPKLLIYLVAVAQLSDVFQYVWGKTLGRHKIVPTVSPSKTWEGFVGGVLTATAVGAGLWWITPFRPWQSAGISFAITIAGFAGGLVMSAIKRDRGVKDYGQLIEGHGGVMDRVDSLCFAAPVFFHIVRYYFA